MTHTPGRFLLPVLSGQRRPELSIDQGVIGCGMHRGMPAHAAANGITLILENHYKDDFLGVSGICPENGRFLPVGGLHSAS